MAMCASGPEALELWRDASSRGAGFDVAIVDMMMPDMTGLEMARLIQSDSSRPSPALILLTSISLPLSSRDLEALGICAHLTKPVRRADLQRALCQIVSGAEPSSGGPGEGELSVSEGFAARILLAEDNPVNQEVAASMLEAIGCTVQIVANGHGALEAVRREEFDLVFMDCQMPEMDGFAATAALRAREEDPSVSASSPGGSRLPIVALTAHATAAHREECLAAGMDDYLSKPFSRGQLLKILERWAPQTRAKTPTRADASRQSATSAAAASTGAVLDAARLDELRALEAASGKDLLSSVIQAFFESSMHLARTIHEAFEADDLTKMGRSAHTLKSSSAQLGATKLSALCKELEARGLAGQAEGVPALLAELDTELEEVLESLTAVTSGVECGGA
jgi:CheY-like chemotaxis protein/HPt (histidine-containing phosphotransfer) domain-containing protein